MPVVKPNPNLRSTAIQWATLCVVLMVAATWALTRVSAWIVRHDEVWSAMDRAGAGRDHMIAELDHFAGVFRVPEAMAVAGLLNLVWLYRVLPPPADRSEEEPR
jgi:hypothetical protein